MIELSLTLVNNFNNIVFFQHFVKQSVESSTMILTEYAKSFYGIGRLIISPIQLRVRPTNFLEPQNTEPTTGIFRQHNFTLQMHSQTGELSSTGYCDNCLGGFTVQIAAIAKAAQQESRFNPWLNHQQQAYSKAVITQGRSIGVQTLRTIGREGCRRWSSCSL